MSAPPPIADSTAALRCGIMVLTSSAGKSAGGRRDFPPSDNRRSRRTGRCSRPCPAARGRQPRSHIVRHVAHVGCGALAGEDADDLGVDRLAARRRQRRQGERQFAPGKAGTAVGEQSPGNVHRPGGDVAEEQRIVGDARAGRRVAQSPAARRAQHSTVTPWSVRGESREERSIMATNRCR